MPDNIIMRLLLGLCIGKEGCNIVETFLCLGVSLNLKRQDSR